MSEPVGIALIFIGVAFDLLGGIGLVRLPDVYNRLQAATKAVTLGTCLILIGVAVASGSTPIQIKAILALVLVLVASPTAAHALARGAYSSGVKLWEKSVLDRYGEDLGLGPQVQEEPVKLEAKEGAEDEAA